MDNEREVIRVDSSEEKLIPVVDWDSMAKCKKCDSNADETIEIKWKKSGGTVTVNGESYELPGNYEHLALKCSRCGFEWLMETADAGERKTEEDEADIPVVRGGHASRVRNK